MKRLKEELTGPTVTEIIQMHKHMWEETRGTPNQLHADSMENASKQSANNFTSKSTPNIDTTTNSNVMPLDAAQSFDRDR